MAATIRHETQFPPRKAELGGLESHNLDSTPWEQHKVVHRQDRAEGETGQLGDECDIIKAQMGIVAEQKHPKLASATIQVRHFLSTSGLSQFRSVSARGVGCNRNPKRSLLRLAFVARCHRFLHRVVVLLCDEPRFVGPRYKMRLSLADGRRRGGSSRQNRFSGRWAVLDPSRTSQIPNIILLTKSDTWMDWRNLESQTITEQTNTEQYEHRTNMQT